MLERIVDKAVVLVIMDSPPSEDKDEENEEGPDAVILLLGAVLPLGKSSIDPPGLVVFVIPVILVVDSGIEIVSSGIYIGSP